MSLFSLPTVTAKVSPSVSTLAFLFVASSSFSVSRVQADEWGGYQVLNGTLNGATLTQDSLIWSSTDVTVYNGLTLQDIELIFLELGPNTPANLNFSGTQTLGGVGTINMTGPGRVRALTGVLTLGEHIRIDGGPYYTGQIVGPIENYGTISGRLQLTGGIVNHGLLEARSNYTLDIDGLTGNIGNATVANGSHLDIDGTFTNDQARTLGANAKLTLRGVWSNSAPISVNSGTLSLLGNWENNDTINVTNSTLILGGSFSPADYGIINRAGGTTRLVGVLENTNNIFTLDSSTGSWELDEGTISQGTIRTAENASFNIASNKVGGLQNVVLDTHFSVTGSAKLQIRDGITFADKSITLAGGGSNIDVYGSAPIQGTGEIVLGGNEYHQITPKDAPLTIGSGIVIRTSPGGAVVGDSAQPLINQGLISAQTPSYTSQIELKGSVVTNEGIIEAKNNGTIILNGNWHNSGVIRVNQGFLNLGGTFTMDDLGTFERTGGTVRVTGVLDNTGRDLILNSTTGSWELGTWGTVLGGRISDGTDGAQFMIQGNVFGGSTATLDQVMINTDFTIPKGAKLVVKNGLTLENGHRITLAAGNDITLMQFDGTQTLSGNGEIVFAGADDGQSIYATSGILTLGPGITVRTDTRGGTLGVYNRPLINQGTISAQTSGKTLIVRASSLDNQGTLEAKNGGFLNLEDPWINNGLIRVENGTLELIGNFATAGLGTISRTGGTINIRGAMDNSASTFLMDASKGSFTLAGSGKIVSGIVTASDGNLLYARGSNPALDGVNLQANLDVEATNLHLQNGTQLNGDQVILRNSGTLTFDAGQSFLGNPEIIFNGTGNSSLVRHTTGTMSIPSGTIIRTGTGGGTVGEASLSLVNQGTISAQTSTRTLSITGSNWNNIGQLAASNGGTLSLNGSIAVGGLGNFNSTGGTIVLAGTLNNAANSLTLVGTENILTMSGGTVQGGSITGSNGAEIQIAAAGTGSFDAVSLATNVRVLNGGTVRLLNGSTLTNGKQISLSNTSSTTVLEMPGSTHFGTGEVVFDGATQNNIVRSISGTLEIASGMTVRTGNGNGTVGNSSRGLVNHGTISSQTTGKSILITGTNWTNDGLLQASNGGTLNLGGTFATSGIGSFSNTGGAINIVGALNNSGATLTATPASGSLGIAGGTITGGSIVTSGGATFSAASGTSTLDAVTLDSDIFIRNGATLRLQNYSPLSTRITLTSEGSSTNLQFIGTGPHFLGGTGEIVFDGTSSQNFVLPFSGGALTIGPDLEVKTGLQGGTLGSASRGLVNQGTISAQTIGKTLNVVGSTVSNPGVLRSSAGTLKVAGLSGEIGTLDLSGTGIIDLDGNYSNSQNRTITAGTLALRGSWTNNSLIDVDGGGLNIGGTPVAFGNLQFNNASLGIIGSFTTQQIHDIPYAGTNTVVSVQSGGIVDNSGNLLTLDAQTGSWQLKGGSIAGGTLDAVEGIGLHAVSGNSVLDGVILAAELTIFNQATVRTQNGMTLADGQIHLNALPNSIATLGTLANDVWAGNGQIILGEGASQVTPSGVLTIESGITILTQASANGASIGSYFDTSNGIVNRGMISSQADGRALMIYAPFTNEGVLEARNGGLLYSGFTGSTSNFSNGVLTGGTWNVFENSVLSPFNGNVTHNSANVLLSGLNSDFTQINSIQQNDGHFTINDGRDFTTAGLFTNNGQLTIGVNSTLTIASDFTQNSEGILEIVVAGIVDTDHGFLEIADSAALIGSLSISIADTFMPTPGDNVQVLSFDEHVGVFSQILGQDIANGLFFNPVYAPTSLTLVVEQAGQGDSDFDGDVDLNDLSVLAANYGAQSGKLWSQGDYDGDGDVDLSDLSILAANYGSGEAQAFADFASIAAVPEPGCAAALLAAGLMLRRRRAA